jgi:hypothetical protein
MYINHVLNDANNFQFTLTVWADSSGFPGKVLYSELIEQEYSNELYGFQRFYLKNPIPVSGKFYIGYQITTKNYLNVGFDQNNNNSEHVFYKTGNYWENSFLAGTPMLRPFIGKAWTPVGINETIPVRFALTIYPNPANDVLFIPLSENINKQDVSIEIFSVSGQKVYSGNYAESINISKYNSGFYILKAYHKSTKERLVSKFIVHH